ncbi:cytochrome c oxidase subunit II [Pedobacter sp. L105]|uniref:cytochrome c oxidase subunit II n=1 Tax=Pedobacter sp. L105 TaxID=1641871 RepID=UPI00131C40AB|nr:cytochrome c oxidase subunit II [Pedobacter sp. L105]
MSQGSHVISIFNPQSAEAWKLSPLNNYLIIACSFIMIVVVGLLIYVTIKFRAKAGDAEPKQIYNNRTVEAFMIGIPFLMVSFFFYQTVKVMNETEPTVQGQVPTVVITGRQWWWQAVYPGTTVVTANEIHLPAGKKVLLQLESQDVIHDWWIPSFGPKMDMIPGVKNYLWVTIGKPGVYEGACSEFCGKQHAWMRIKVIADSPADYQQWLLNKSKAALPPADTLALAGAVIFNKKSCADCHSIRGTPAQGKSGPDLTHLASRTTLLAGMMTNTKEHIKRFINNPEGVKPGVRMPRFIFKKDTVNALVAYLSNLK